MIQGAEAQLNALRDRLAVEDLVTGYAAAVDDGDWDAYRALFTPSGRADYRSAGGVEGDMATIAEWLSGAMGLFPVRQHLIVNKHTTVTGDDATVRADYVNPMRSVSAPASAPDLVCAGRYAFTASRTADGWRLTDVVVEERWRQTPG